MASEGQRVPTYPVWVGNLKETVKEKDLKRVFSKHGQIASCKVMVDEAGNSKCFGYVNYYTEDEAERAASAKHGYKISGVAIKTKGPKLLNQKGYFKPSPPRPEGQPPPSQDFRPLTDCSFFVMGKKCKKAGSCPYRHSEAARSSELTCSQWVERNCLNVHCPYRHPGGKEKKDDIDAEVVSGSGLELIRCGGRCGQATCAAHFASKEDLSQHIKMSRLLQCRHCRAIFFTDIEYREHKMSCRARMNSGSTDLSSDSVDIEELSDSESDSDSDSDSTDTESDEENPANPFSGSSGAGQLPQLRKAVDPIHKSASANVIIPSKKQFPPRDRTNSESDAKTKGELATPTKYSSPPKTRKGRLDSNKKASNTGTSSSKASDLYGFMTTDPDSGSVLYPGIGGYGVSYDDGVIVEYSDSDSDDSDYDDEEGDVDASPSEMTRLLSLNDQDMYESEGSDDEEEEEGEGLEFSAQTVQEEDRGNGVKKTRHGKATKQGSKKPIADGGMVKSPHRVKLEPVGVFWDIENCPVPIDKSAFSLAAKMRSVFFEGKREAEFMCVCDVTKERKEVTDDLHKAQVTLVHVNAIAKNAADDKLRQSLRRFAHTYPAPSTVVLISGDVNFSSELTDLRHVHNITIVLVHNPQASQALKVFAHKLINYYEFLEDVEPPQQPQHSTQPRVVIVSGLPKHMPVAKLSQRLDRLSDNCGGKVLKVDLKTGTAKILFRTPEWASKALKRMAGEDVYGYKVTTSLETQPPPHVQQKHGPSQQMRSLSGSALSNSFPPHPPPSPSHHHPHDPHFGSPQPRRPPLMSPPYPPHPNYFHQHPGMFSPPGPAPAHFGAPRPPHPHMPPPQRVPLMSPPHQGGGRFPPAQPRFPPGQLPSSQVYPQPLPACAIRAPLHTAPPSKIRGPEGKILVFRIPAVPEVALDQLNGQVVAIRLEACVKAEHLILWHNLSELQVLMRLDFIQTASAMKEDVIRMLIEKNKLKKELAQEFLQRCASSIEKVSKLRHLPWEVTLCGWTADEEEERVVRSKVVALLRRYSPYYWTKWNTFKQKFNEVYASAVSEMAIHNACRGAVQILGNPGNTQNQVIIFYELSPLVKVVNSQQGLAQLQKNFIRLLNSQPDKKIKLLDFVRVYKDSKIGALPVSSSGKLLQEVIANTPNITMVGVKPSNIYVTLGTSDKGPVAFTPQNLPGISAAFVNLLVHTSSGEIPLSQFQQEYQTFYHKSFRVSDYLSGSARLRDLLEKCSGIKLKDIPLPSGGVRTLVALDDEKPSTVNQGPADSPSKSSFSRRSPVPAVPGDLAALSAEFRSLLVRFPDRRLPLNQFQQEYQTFFHHSFRVSDYLSKEDAGLRDLLNVCQGIKVVNVMLANGRIQAFVYRTEDVQPTPPSPSKVQKSASSASINIASPSGISSASASQPTATDIRVSPTPDTIPAESIQLFKRECVEVLGSLPDRRVQLARFPEAYYKVKGQMFTLARYKAKKIVLLAQAIPDTVRILGDKEDKVLELITGTKKDFEERVQRMLYSLPNQSITLDRFVSEYEKYHGQKLSNFYGHSKLLRLLEDLPDSVRLKGKGPARIVELQPRCTFVMDMAQLVSFHPEGLPISKVVPIYKSVFGRELVVANLGYSKLIKALESIPNILVIRGEGPSRVILPKLGPPAGVASPPPPPPAPASLPPLQIFADEIVAILMATFSQQLSLIQLTARYNTCFRMDQPQITKEQLLDALKKLPNFKITGSGITTNVQLAPHSPDRSQQAGGSKAKRKAKTSESKDKPESETEGAQADTKSAEPVVNTVDDKLHTAHAPASPVGKSQSAVKKEAISDVSEHLPVLTKPEAQLEDDEKEGKRLFSETRRMLQLHHEHAMTLAELVERFRENEEPSLPTAEQLYQQLTKFNAKEGGSGGGKTAKILQISYIPGSVGDSIIQLGIADCFQKLSDDFIYLFIYHPTRIFSMSVSELESCYAECYGRKLVPAIYAAKSIQKLFTWKQVVKVIQFNSSTGICQLTRSGRLTALAALLAELLFTRGAGCSTLDDLLELYQEHFGVPLFLEHFGVDSILSLIELPEIKEVVKLVDVQIQEDTYQVKPVLSTSSLLMEQLRYLLTIHDGCLPMEQVESAYTSTFGIQAHINIADLLERNKIIRVAPHVVNVTGNNKWLVWAPTGRPYPNQSRKSSLLQKKKEGTIQNSNVDIVANENTKSDQTDKSEVTVNKYTTNIKTDAGVVEDNELPTASQLKPHPIFSELATTPDVLQDTKKSSTVHNDMPQSIETSVAMSVDTHTQVNTEESIPKVGGADACANFIESSVDPPTTTVANPSQTSGDSGEVTAETYGFLEETLEPELMAELRASGEQHQQREQTLGELLNTQPLSEHAIQLLLHFAKPMSEIDLEDSNSDNADEPEKQDEANQPHEPVDYLASDMSPDQVLEEMRKLKEHSGGYLSPDKMEPFLTYFGELSSRELDRLEALEEKEKAKSKKGAAKKKRVMAIRFPDKSPAPLPPSDDDPYKEQRLYSAELLKDKLPAAPDFENMSDSSDSDSSCPRPLEREEYIQTLLQRGIPTLNDEEIMRATQVPVVVSKAESSPSIDWPSLGTDSGIGTDVCDLPKPLLPMSEAGYAAAHQLFGDAQFMADRNSAESKATEWPDLK